MKKRVLFLDCPHIKDIEGDGKSVMHLIPTVYRRENAYGRLCEKCYSSKIETPTGAKTISMQLIGGENGIL